MNKMMKRIMMTVLLSVLVAAALPVDVANALATYWTDGDPGDSDWSTGANWHNGEPGSGDFAGINGGTAEITQSGEVALNFILGTVNGTGSTNMSSGDLTVGNRENIGYSGGSSTFTQSGGTNSTSELLIGVRSSGTGIYNLSGGNLEATSAGTSISLGDEGTGTFNQSGGINTVTNDLNMGFNTGSSGTYNLNGGTLDVGGDITRGDGSSRLNYNGGTLTVTGGNISVDRFYMGDSSGSNASHTIGTGETISADYEYVGRYGTAAVIQNDGDNAVTYDLNVGFNANSTGTYDLNGGTLSAYSENLGYKGTATFNQAGGTNTIGNDLHLGVSSGTAEYNLNGGTLDVGDDILNGGGTSTLNIDGGTLNMSGVGGAIDVDTFRLGKVSNGSHTLESGDSLTANEEIIGGGSAGQSTFTHSGGTNTVANNLTFGVGSSQGFYNLNGGTLNVGGDIDNEGTSNLNIDGGTLNMSSGGAIGIQNLRVGNSSGSNGSYTQDSGESISAIDETIGVDGIGSFTQNGGTNSIASDLILGDENTGNGTYNLVDGTVSSHDLLVGNRGTGTFTQSGGTYTFANDLSSSLTIGMYSGGDGTYNLNGGTLSARTLNIGFNGTGSFVQNGGTNSLVGIGKRLYLGTSSSGSGTYSLNSGDLSTKNEYIGSSGTGVFTQSGGTNTVTNALTIASNSGSSGEYNLSGGTLTAGSVVNNDTFNYSGGTLNSDVTNNSDFNLSGTGTRTVNGDFTNDGTVNVTDTTVAYTGTFTNNGAYISDPSDNFFTDIDISDTGYLVGGAGDNFFVSGDFISSSTQNSLWGTTEAYLGFTGAGTHDFYLTGSDYGAVTSGIIDNYAWGTLSMMESDIALNLTDGNAETGGALYLSVLDAAGGITQIQNSIFSDYNIYYDSTALGNSYLGGLTYGLSGSGFLTPYSTTQPVPEPATIALLGIGLAGLGLGYLMRRRRLKKKEVN